MLPSASLLLCLCLSAPPTADQDYNRGMALARAQRWDEAEQAFQAGQQSNPHDKRFPLELAGIAFKRKNYSAARVCLRRALRLDPADSYAHDFLATLYLLDGNLEAALKHWNLVGKPQINEVRIDPQPRVDPVLLDRAFTFSPASVLELPDFFTTQARLQRLEIFPYYQFDLIPTPGEKFDLVFRPRERNGWGDSTLDGLLGLLRGAPYQAIHPEFYNLRRSALNVASMLRWDAQKRRAFATLSAPLIGNPKWRYQISFDARKETWDLARSQDLHLQRIEAAAELQSIAGARWAWSSGIHLTSRTFRGLTAPVFTNGVSLKYRTALDYRLLRIPERRLAVTSTASWQLGRLFAPSFHAFSKMEGAVEAHWLPQSRGDDYETTARFRAGKTLGDVPFDELYMLGLERDNDLWLRGHIGTRNGKKGSAPLGRDYVLFNWELDKTIYKNAFLQLKLGPFLDTGRIYDESGGFGSPNWLWDTGAQCKLRALHGPTLIFSYGKSLRTGQNAFYTLVKPSAPQ